MDLSESLCHVSIASLKAFRLDLCLSAITHQGILKNPTERFTLEINSRSENTRKATNMSRFRGRASPRLTHMNQ